MTGVKSIAGILGGPVWNESDDPVARMLATMSHGGRESSGRLGQRELRVSLGWVGEEVPSRPWKSDDGLVSLVVAGDPVIEDSDGNVGRALIRSYESRGEGFLRGVDGFFAGLLIDLREEKAVLFNDRYGMHRIYYRLDSGGETVLFASEAKAVLSVCPDSAELDHRGVGELLTLNCVLDDRSLFKNVGAVPGGSAWVWRRKGLSRRKYFDAAEWEAQPPLEEEDYYQRLKETFGRRLGRYFEAEAPVAMALTGGLDSRMIMCFRDFEKGSLPCFTFRGPVHETFDSRVGRRIADLCGQSHVSIPLEKGFLTDFPRLAEEAVYRTDGALDVRSTHDLYFSRKAREIAPFRMTGQFGSEVIRDRPISDAPWSPKTDFLNRDLLPYLQQARTRLSELQRSNAFAFRVFSEIPWRSYPKHMIEKSHVTVRSPYLDSELVQLIFRAPATARKGPRMQLRLMEETKPALRRVVASRGVGPRSRPAQFLSRLLYTGAFKVDYVYLYQCPEWLVRLGPTLRATQVEKLLLGFFKLEHYRLWFRTELSGFLRDILLSTKAVQRGWFQRSVLERMLTDHEQSKVDYSDEISKALTLELTACSLLDRQESPRVGPTAAAEAI